MELEGFQEISGLLHCAVYALVHRREVVYVGQTRQPWIRLYAHVNARGKAGQLKAGYRTVKHGVKFDQLFIRSCMLAELDQLELDMIAKYRPKHNVKGVPKATPQEMEALIAALITVSVPIAQPKLHRRF
jgi:hypothetical protein